MPGGRGGAALRALGARPLLRLLLAGVASVAVLLAGSGRAELPDVRDGASARPAMLALPVVADGDFEDGRLPGALSASGAFRAGGGEPCDNGANAGNCAVPPFSIPLPVLGLDRVEVSGVGVNQDVSCAAGSGCGELGFGPVAIGGNASCTATVRGCGYVGVGAVAIGGDASCQSASGCGTFGVGAVAVGGDAICAGAEACRVGAIAIGGNALCFGDGCDVGAIAAAGEAQCGRHGGNAEYSRCGHGATAVAGNAGCKTGRDGCRVGAISVGGGASCWTYSNGCMLGAIAIGGPAGCDAASVAFTGGCSFAIAVGGPASCRVNWGAGCNGGIVAVGGNASCFGDNYGAPTCGAMRVSTVSVGGSSYCTSGWDGCGYFGLGPVATGSAACSAGSAGCGHVGTGPIALTGDVRCSGTCGSGGSVSGLSREMPRRGTPGVTVLGRAYCSERFDAARASDAGHLQRFGCVSAWDAAGLPRVTP